jgi:amidase
MTILGPIHRPPSPNNGRIDLTTLRPEHGDNAPGIPMTVKESFKVAGLPTTFGNPLSKDNIATGNAFLIDRLHWRI